MSKRRNPSTRRSEAIIRLTTARIEDNIANYVCAFGHTPEDKNGDTISYLELIGMICEDRTDGRKKPHIGNEAA